MEYRARLWRDARGDLPGKRQEQEPRPGQREDNFFGYDLKWKEDYYVNEFLAPAIEATERASKDVYGDPLRIQVALGSMNPYNRQNIEFLANVMDRTFDGRQAPTLKGEPIWKHIDLLTVHSMTGSPRSIETLQQYHDDYLKTGKVKGIWITEDHGRAGKGPVTILDRGLRFLAWAARNNLSGAQTRLCWWGEGEREPGGSGREATALLGGFLAGRPLHLSHRQESTANIYVLTDATDAKLSRGIVAIVPERFGALDCGKLTVALPADAVGETWSARAVSYDISKSFPGEIGQYRVSRSSKNVKPFEIMDGLYYVGNSQVSAHLLTSSNGLILLDSTMPHQVAWLLENIRKLGFRPADVKVVIGSHAHLDHIGGHWY